MSEHVEEAHRLVEAAARVAGLPLLYSRFLDNAAEAVVIVGQDGRIALFNRKATFLFGYPAEEAVGQPVEMLLPDALKGIHERHRAGYVGDPYTRAMGATLDLRARHKDGSEIPVLIDLHPEQGTNGTYVRAAVRRKPEPAAPPAVPSGR